MGQARDSVKSNASTGSKTTTTTKKSSYTPTPSKTTAPAPKSSGGYSLPKNNFDAKPVAKTNLTPKTSPSYNVGPAPGKTPIAGSSWNVNKGATPISAPKAVAPKTSSSGYSLPKGNPDGKPQVPGKTISGPVSGGYTIPKGDAYAKPVPTASYAKSPMLTSVDNMRTINPVNANKPVSQVNANKPGVSNTQVKPTVNASKAFANPADVTKPGVNLAMSPQNAPMQPGGTNPSAPVQGANANAPAPGFQFNAWKQTAGDGTKLGFDGDAGYIPEGTLVKYNQDGTTSYIDKASGQELYFNEGGLYKEDGTGVGGVYDMNGDFKPQDAIKPTKWGAPPSLIPPEVPPIPEPQAVTQIGGVMDEIQNMWSNVQSMNNEMIAQMVAQNQNTVSQIDKTIAQVTDTFKSQSLGDDPQLMAALGLVRQEAANQLKIGLEELNSRGVVQSGQLNEMMDRLSKGVLTQEQQLIGNRMSEITTQLNSAILGLSQSRIQALTQGNSNLAGMMSTGMQTNASMANSMTGALVDVNGQLIQNEQFGKTLDYNRWKANGDWGNELTKTNMTNQNAWNMNLVDNETSRYNNNNNVNADIYRTDTNAAVQREGNNLSYNASIYGSNHSGGGGSRGPSFSDLLKAQGYQDERSAYVGGVIGEFDNQVRGGKITPQEATRQVSLYYGFNPTEIQFATNAFASSTQPAQHQGGSLSDWWKNHFGSTPSKTNTYTLNKDR